MKRFAFGLILSSALAVPAGVLAQPVSAPAAAADPYAALDAAIARERQAIEARDRAMGEAEAKQAAAAAAAASETRSREDQLAALDAVENEMATLLDRVEALNARPRKLLVEKTVLEGWYEDLQPVVAHLTSRSFRGAELELEALAQNGEIEPGVRRFASYRDLRDAIAALGDRIARNKADSAREATALRQQLDPLVQRRQQAMDRLAMADPAGNSAALDWFGAARELERRRAEALAARDAVDQAMRGVLDATARMRPPILSDVAASVDGTVIYTANWRRGDGTSPDEQAREAKRRELQARRMRLETAIGDLGQLQRQNAAVRGQMAETMMRRSAALERSAARYADKRMFQAQSAVALDIGLTVAELLITGGSATLARKSVTAAQAVADRAAARRTINAAASPLQAAIIRHRPIPGGRTLAEALTAASETSERALAGELRQLVSKLRMQGLTQAAAEARGQEVFGEALAALRKTDRRYRNANAILAGSADAIEQSVPAAEIRRILNEAALVEGTKEGAGKFVGGKGPDLVIGQDGRVGGAENVDEMTKTAVGEAIEFGLARAADTWSAPASHFGSEALGNAAKLQAKAINGLTANGVQIGVGFAFSMMETAYAGYQDARVNTEANNFNRLLVELDLLYNVYRGYLEHDRAVDRAVADLYGELAEVRGSLALLDGGLTLTMRPSPKQVSRDGRLTLGLGFSVPLASAPAVSVGGFPVAMQRSDGGGQRWSGSIPVASFGKTGVQPIKVAAPAAATSYGALDSNPATPAIRLTSRSGWRGYEPGPDMRHVIPLMIAREEQPPAVASDPFEEGRAMVDPGYGEPGPFRASDLVGLWTGTGYTCEGNEPDELIRVTSPNGIDIIATKLRGDACVRAGEVTWRGRLNGRRIIVKAHMRAPHGAVSSSAWVDDTVEVISSDEMTAFGVRYRRANPPR